ncbi:MAG TPA: YsnF/AvaK domain-containing protein [Allosphingosinicella sp.]|nr:YsnF/AvaK domain-containing protein [Allosphingosinicella sp.]
MSRTITAMFDSRDEAEAARTRLSQSQIDADRVRIIDKNASTSSASGSGAGEEQGFWSALRSAFLPEEDGQAYEEGMRRGGYLLCADVDETDADRACDILDQSGSVDFDQRQDAWRSEGWQGAAAGTAQARETGQSVEEERIPLVEEELRVGKREVARGGARVRSYIKETPVHEQVALREEHVSIERRPVGETLDRGALGSDSDLLRERTVEMTETAEEAVVEKQAHVREELVVKKTAEQRTEQIDDTVRRTEVEVDETRGGEDRSAFGGFSGADRQTAQQQGSQQQTGFGGDNEGREREGAGYDPRIDKSGL